MKGKWALILSLVLLLCIVCYKIVFVPVSLEMQSRPEQVFALSNSPVTVKATVVNKLGFAVPFDRLSGKFVVNQGSDMIDVVRTTGDEIVFTTKGTTGRLVIYFYSKAIAFPVEIVLDIKGSSVAGLIGYDRTRG